MNKIKHFYAQNRLAIYAFSGMIVGQLYFNSDKGITFILPQILFFAIGWALGSYFIKLLYSRKQ